MSGIKSSHRMANKIANLSRAVARLNEAVAVDPESNLLAIDGTIKRFEFAASQFWSTLRLALELSGVVIAGPTPRKILKEAFSVDWLQDEETWLDMLEDRNNSAHEYNEKVAKEVYYRITSRYARLLNQSFITLKEIVEEIQEELKRVQ